MQVVNQRLHEVADDDGGYFGTAVYATYDAASGQLRCVCAGHPAPLLFRTSGAIEHVGCPNPPLGMAPDDRYEEITVEVGPGDALLLFTDGATEILDAAKRSLGAEGLKHLACTQGGRVQIPEFSLATLERHLLQYSNQIRLPNDLTLIKLRRPVGQQTQPNRCYPSWSEITAANSRPNCGYS